MYQMWQSLLQNQKIKTKLAWNFQTEEKFALQHFYILLSLVDLILFSIIHVAEVLL